MNQIDIFFF